MDESNTCQSLNSIDPSGSVCHPLPRVLFGPHPDPMPVIDPFSMTDHSMSDREIQERLECYKIATDLPLIIQISRFDRWKDPWGAVQAFQMARKKSARTLVLLGNAGTDDPEGPGP
jgi:trehalose synthase